MESLTKKFKLLGKRKFSEMVPAFCALETGKCNTCKVTRLLNSKSECYTCFYGRVDGLHKDLFNDGVSIHRIVKKQ